MILGPGAVRRGMLCWFNRVRQEKTNWTDTAALTEKTIDVAGDARNAYQQRGEGRAGVWRLRRQSRTSSYLWAQNVIPELEGGAGDCRALCDLIGMGDSCQIARSRFPGHLTV